MILGSGNAQKIQQAFEQESGSILLEFAIPPASQQSPRLKKDTVTGVIQNATATARYLITGEVRVEIDWYIHERIRYETQEAPDVDNIVKPTLDALAGPNGLMIDDCQVQAIDCRWISANDDTQSFSIRLSFVPDEFISKNGVHFVLVENGLCVPLDNSNHASVNLLILRHYLDSIAIKDEAMSDGWSWDSAKTLLPIRRMFHRSRVGKFPVFTLREYLLGFGLSSMPTIETIHRMDVARA